MAISEGQPGWGYQEGKPLTCGEIPWQGITYPLLFLALMAEKIIENYLKECSSGLLKSLGIKGEDACGGD